MPDGNQWAAECDVYPSGWFYHPEEHLYKQSINHRGLENTLQCKVIMTLLLNFPWVETV